jgi:CheY-like chemotaxis protein/HPt (histidine-containing phosphotransfer) domain-containing protein
MFVDRADKKNLEMACSLSRDVPRTVAGDPVRLRQVLLNLVSNAIKFTETGEVVVSALVQEQSETHTLVRFEVRDSGVGIPADRLDRLFRSFSQVDASTTRKFGGTGLGLAICHRLAELFGGQIGVHSFEGKGSTFWFTARLEMRAQILPVTRETVVDLRGKRVLAVDDNSTNREILQAQLSSWRLRADIADGAQQAMTMLQKAAESGEPYHFAILDMHMPKTDGIQLASQIKSDPATRDVILISLSSISDHLKPAQMGKVGFAACLTKPALPSELYNAIIDSLSAHEQPGVLNSSHTLTEQVDDSSINGLRILLAEDNEVNRLVASELLAHAGCHCTMVVNGREAVEEALRNEYDAILMDCQMPEMDGFAATRAIRDAEAASEPLRHRSIIALTANAIKGDREQCLAAGMDGYVTKPIDPPQLFSAIHSMLSPERREQIGSQQAIERERPLQVRQEPAATPSAAPTEMPHSLPIDLASLQKRCMGSRRIAAKALSKFDSTTEQDVRALFEGVQRGDAKAVAASAHKIKGAAANVSAEAVRGVASEIEHLAAADSLAQSQACLDRLRDEMSRFREYLSVALADLTSPDLPVIPQSAKPVASEK